MKKLSIMCLLLGACVAQPFQQDDLWLVFQNRCLIPFLENKGFATEDLQAVPPETLFPENDVSSLSKGFESRSGSWKMFTASDGSSGVCMILSQGNHPVAIQAAADWAARAVENDGFMYDHHFSDEIEKGNTTISFGDHIRGWKTAFIVDGEF